MKALLHRLASPLAFVAVLLLWEAACRMFAIPVFVLPAPSAVALAAIEVGVVRWSGHLWATLEVALAGYALAVACAIPLAMAIVGSPLMSRILLPWLIVVQSTPIVAIAPIIVVTLGAGLLPRVVITALIAFFPVVISTAAGLAAVPAELIELSRSLRATRSREYRQIRLPHAVPYIFSALKVAITLSVIGAVVAEFVAADRGLGYLIMFSTSTFKVPVAFAALFLLVACSLALYGCVVACHRVFFPWSLAQTH